MGGMIVCGADSRNMEATALDRQEMELGNEIGNLTLWESMARRTAMHPLREALVVRT